MFFYLEGKLFPFRTLKKHAFNTTQATPNYNIEKALFKF